MANNPEKVIDYPSALRAIRNPAVIGSPHYQEQKMRANRVGAHPDILRFTDCMIAELEKLDVPMFAHMVVRTPDQQNVEYVQGDSLVKGSDPYPHKFAAVDLIHSQLAWGLPRKAWEQIGVIGFEVAKRNRIAVVWGGDFKSLWDPAHWELAFWRAIDPVTFRYSDGRDSVVKR